MGNSFFDEDGGFAGSGYEPIYNGTPANEENRREERTESKEGRVVFTGKDLTDRRRDRLPVYALILGVLSIFCIFFTNGYLVSMLGLLVDAHALNKGTRRKTVAMIAAICCGLAILLYIVCVAAKPLLSDMEWYVIMMDKVNSIFNG